VSEFMATKREDKNLDPGYVGNLEYYLSDFLAELGRTPISEIEQATISKILAGLNRKARSRNNTLDAVRALFRFARERGYLPDELTEAEKIKRLKLRRAKEIAIYTPEEMRARLDKCRHEYIPGKIIPAFASIREEEVRPKCKSHKDHCGD
jgi:integrase